MTQGYPDIEAPAQADLFTPDRWPRRPWCTNNPEHGMVHRSLVDALTRPYVQANPPHLRVWSIQDIDRPGAALAWEDANLPPPTWAAVSRETGRAHLVWGLSAPVLVDGLGARDAPMRYLCAVESLMRERLGADLGYTGLLTKNPAHPLWRVLRGPRLAYDLGELAEYLPGLEKHKPRKRPELVGLGRNVALFDCLRQWAYKGIRKHWGGGIHGWNAWVSECNSRALVLNGEFPIPLHGREVWHIAKSVAKWTWRNTTERGFSAWQAEQGRRAMRARWGDNTDRRASARLMAARGMSTRQIAAELGVDNATVWRWLKS